jgi:hypothetical protein
MTRVSQLAGYLASFFALAHICFLSALRSKSDGRPEWLDVLQVWCMMLAAFSGVVCLASAAASKFRKIVEVDP